MELRLFRIVDVGIRDHIVHCGLAGEIICNIRRGFCAKANGRGGSWFHLSCATAEETSKDTHS